eukprot:6185915-Pleurochrysis_carterae.AAC.1
MSIPSLEILGGFILAVASAAVAYIIRTRTSRVKLCCGFVECYRRVRRSFSSRSSSSDASLDSRNIP